jgi:hypothetical protein
MIAWVGVAVTLLASPADRGGPQPLSSDVLSPTLVRPVPEIGPAARLEAMLGELAVVRPGTLGAATGSMVLFVLVAPVSRHSLGLQAVGSF